MLIRFNYFLNGIGIDFKTLSYDIDGENVKVQIWYVCQHVHFVYNTQFSPQALPIECLDKSDGDVFFSLFYMC